MDAVLRHAPRLGEPIETQKIANICDKNIIVTHNINRFFELFSFNTWNNLIAKSWLSCLRKWLVEIFQMLYNLKWYGRRVNIGLSVWESSFELGSSNVSVKM